MSKCNYSGKYEVLAIEKLWAEYQRKKLTALEGDGQQCKAAPAWTAATDPDENGSLETSALTRARLLQILQWSVNQDSTLIQPIEK